MKSAADTQVSQVRPSAIETPCPACKGGATTLLGNVQSSCSDFGFTNGGPLYKCHNCHLLFLRKPKIASQPEAYAALPADLLDQISARADFDLAKAEILRTRSQVKVLDVGCFRGDFLSSLPHSVKKFGIEPSISARRVAQEHGITLVGESIETTANGERQYDFIIMMDVLEHLSAPFEALQRLRQWLAPGGRLILSTGNSDSLLWRLVRLNYYYYLPQHITFCNEPWFRWVATQLDVRLEGVFKFSHSRRAYGKRFIPEHCYHLAKCAAACVASRIGLRSKFQSVQGDATWRDHLMVVLEAPKESSPV